MTSSAVVGSSAMTSDGSAGERHRDQHALPHAARELVRVVVARARCGSGMRTASSSSTARAVRLAPRRAAVHQQRLRDLVADREDRIERRHRLLEDQRDLGAAHLAHLALGERQQVAALEADRARRRSARAAAPAA